MSGLLYENKYFNVYSHSINCDNITQNNPIGLFASISGSPTYNESNNSVPIEINSTVKYSNGIYLDPLDNRKIRFNKTGVYQFNAVLLYNGEQTPTIDDATACYSLACQFKQFANDGTLKDFSHPYGTTFNISGSYFQSLSINTLLNIDNITDYVILNSVILSNEGLNFNWNIQNGEVNISQYATTN